ncbi:Dyp-type peroxidase [Neisseria sp. Ec49-e6-T10]|uniref:Dyp-type peroxidase n=1 Tax=Neisseria sp. Ec49-e6-T10 TaxID=3140744 RepID=UPI003EB736DF
MPSKAQSGILLEHCRFGIFIEARITTQNTPEFKKAIQTVCGHLDTLKSNYPDAALGAVIAFGSDAWKKISSSSPPSELKPFTTLGNAPATQRDLLIHILANRFDVAFSMAQQTLEALKTHIQVEEETHGFRWVEERDLTGFVDGTENPQGEQRPEVALIADDQEHAHGSYVFTQRYVHHMPKWHDMPVHEQEQIIGRTKQDSEELPSNARPDTSHVSRVDLKEDGKGLKILRQSLPYGKASGEHGLFFIAYCASLYNIEQQLLSMFGQLDGKTDLLLNYTTPVSGSYFFAPSLDELLTM